jgi:enamine deaminase RidA (YjgF/YER057c/UK114 family)
VAAVPEIERRLADLGLQLPPEAVVPSNVSIPFQWVRIRGTRALTSGHGALSSTGTPTGPFGAVPSQVSLEEAQNSARQALLSLLGSLARALGDLDKVVAWLSLTAFVNADPGFEWTTLVLNPASELLIELYGPDAGAHARTAPGVTALPFNLPVVIAAEAEVAST